MMAYSLFRARGLCLPQGTHLRLFGSSAVSSQIYKTVPEQSAPVEGTVTGSLPSWLSGRLIRNGPGMFEIGDTKLNHLFDGMAMLHSFTISSGKVLYHNQFLRSNSYKKNMAANRLVVSELGTMAVPDPCQSLFQRFTSHFKELADMPGNSSDNCLVNVFPVGGKMVAATESDFLHVFSPDTLETKERVRLSQHTAVFSATAHPHIDPDGTVYNLGGSREGSHIIKIPPVADGEHLMAKASVLCTVPPENKLLPGYSHSFASTDNYLVFLDQSVKLDVKTLMWKKVMGKQVLIDDLFVYNEKEQIRFHVVEKATGKVLPNKLFAPPGAIIHHINAYEENGCIMLDASYYENGLVYTVASVDAINSLTDEDQMNGLLAKPVRYVLPLQPGAKIEEEKSVAQEDGSFLCYPTSISELGFELPQINYRRYNGKPYRYAYGINQILTTIIKADVSTRDCLTWSLDEHFPSEPVFVERPDPKTEDDGVLLSAVLSREKGVWPFLLVLDASSMQEVARVTFPGVEMHKDFHGMFLPD